MRERTSSSNALAVLRTAAEDVEAYLRSKHPNIRAGKSASRVTDYSGFHAGKSAGASLSMPGAPRGQLGAAPRKLRS